jgi:hypothetical protein
LLGNGHLFHWIGHEMNPTPKCPNGAFEAEITISDVDFICHLDYVPAEKGSRGSLGDPYEPDIDESMVLLAVYVARPDSDIQSFMATTFLDQIERKALAHFKDNTP